LFSPDLSFDSVQVHHFEHKNEKGVKISQSVNWQAGLDGGESISGRSTASSIFTTTSRTTQGLTQPPILSILHSPSLRVKQLEHETDHSSHSNAKAKNMEIFTSTLPYA